MQAVLISISPKYIFNHLLRKGVISTVLSYDLKSLQNYRFLLTYLDINRHIYCDITED